MPNPKLNPITDPITDKEMADFVASSSDFEFEMRVVAELESARFDCSHSGSYQDPVTGKIRQFDIRARRREDFRVLLLAVECKNLRPASPLLLSCVPRSMEEAQHDVIVRRLGQVLPGIKVNRVSGFVYRPVEMVGKKTDQIKRNKEGPPIRSEQDTFEKVNQAVNSCKDLVRQLVSSGELQILGAVVPVLVVPENSLWQVEYAADGRRAAEPHQVTHATLLLNHSWSVDRGNYGVINYRLSHLELITVNAPRGIALSWFGPHGFFAGVS